MSSQTISRVLSVLPLVGHPRDSKRISMLQNCGFEVEAAAFERPYHEGRLPSCAVRTLGQVEHGSYFLRACVALRSLPLLRDAIRRNDIVYASGADMALMALVASAGLKRPVVVEIGDVRELQVADGLLGKTVRRIDRGLVDRCGLIVVTSPPFLDQYYREWLGTKTSGLVIENKLERDSLARRPLGEDSGFLPLKNERPLRIGYFGLLRDNWSFSVLRGLAEQSASSVEVVFAGLPFGELSDLRERIQGVPNMRYIGEYTSPDGLPELYGQVDLVWACYPPIADDDWNLKWARPNRFYESCFFQTPTITRAGCQDAVDVEAFNIGKILQTENVTEAVDELSRITPDEVDSWQQGMRELSDDVFVYTNEETELKSALLSLLS